MVRFLEWGMLLVELTQGAHDVAHDGLDIDTFGTWRWSTAITGRLGVAAIGKYASHVLAHEF